jgi:hypothetical protein
LHDYIDLTDLTTTCSSLDSTGNIKNPCAETRVRGRSYGLELLVRRSLVKRLTGWVSYTLSRATRQTRPIGAAQALQTIPGEFDRTHVLSVIGAYDLGRAWRIGARFYFYTGRPYGDRINDVLVPPYNSERLPAFYRIDARLEKRWALSRGGHVAAYLEGLNVTLQKEATGVSCSPRMTTMSAPASTPVGIPGNLPHDVCTPDLVGPITIPSIGVEAAL